MASTRRLAAILAADVAGYSRLMGEDEEGTQHAYGLISANWLIQRSRNIEAVRSRTPATACSRNFQA